MWAFYITVFIIIAVPIAFIAAFQENEPVEPNGY